MAESFKMIAKTMYGLENVLVKELEDIGAKEVKPLVRAVEFMGNMRMLYKANYLVRTALCILKPIYSFVANNEDQLYHKVFSYSWEKLLNPDGTFVIESSVSSDIFNHSLYVAQKTKDAICDRFRKYFNVRPSVDKIDPDLKIDVHISNNEVTICIDSSGDKLFKRGYRKQTNLAPLNEVTAAGLILLSGWQRDTNFLDPMCGSGTLAIEAAMYAQNIPPQYFRKNFGFMRWSSFNRVEYEQERNLADRQIKEFNYEIWASDISQQAVDMAKENIHFAHLQHDINVFLSPMEKGLKPEGKTFVITNPPYGERLEVEDVVALYERMGSTFKQFYNDCSVFVISSDIFALKRIGLKPSKKIKVYNGKLECRLFEFDIYEGSKKLSKQKPQQENN